MIHFSKMRVQKYGLYEDATLKFRKGVTFLLGKNLNRRDPNASNASGKSMLAGALTASLRDTHTVVVKGGKSVAKALFKKGGSVETHFKGNDGQGYIHVRAASHQKLFRNGEDLNSRVVKDSLAILQPWNDDEWFTTIYVDGRRMNNFLLGTAADRAQFITRLFRLDDMDELRRYFGRNIASLRELETERQLLQDKIQECKTSLAKYPKNLTTLVSDKRKNLDDLQRQRRELQSLVHEATLYKQYRSIKIQLERLETPRFDRKTITSCVRELHQYEGKLEEIRRRNRQMEKINAEYATLKREVGSLASDLRRMESRYESISAKRIHKPDTVEQPQEDPAYDLDKLEQQWEKLTSSLNHKQSVHASLSNLDCDECPTCKQPIPDKTRKLIKLLEGEIASIKDKRKRVKYYMDLHRQWDEYDQYCSHLSAYKQWVAEYAKIRDYPFDQVRRFLSLSDTLASVEKIEPPKLAINSIDEAERLLTILDKRSSLTDQMDSLRKQLSGSDPKQYKDLDVRLSSIDAKIRKLTSSLPKLEAALSMSRHFRKEGRQAVERLNEIADKVRDLPVYELLQEAYSNTGVKQLIISSLCKSLEKNLNIYSKHTFDEGFKFNIHIEDNRFDIMVTRSRGGAVEDVRTFSGAESRLFAIVFLLALLPMIPASRRSNLLILDEPTANMDQPLLATFRDVLLPQLKKIVPSILVITPNHELVPSNARVITAVKKGTASTLVEGAV